MLIKILPKMECSLKTKHTEIAVHFIRDQVADGGLQIYYVPSIDKVANCLTKALSHTRFSILRYKLGVITTPASLRGEVRAMAAQLTHKQSQDC